MEANRPFLFIKTRERENYMHQRSAWSSGIGLLLVGLLAILEACASTSEPATPTPEVFNPLPPEQRAFEAVREVLAGQLGLDPLAIRMVETTPVDWPDACLGLAASSESCAQTVTPGFRITVETGGTSYEFHTNRDGSLVRSSTQ
jgi:hypothetical protein